MSRTKRISAVVVLLVTALTLAGCTPATVCDRRYNTKEDRYEIRYKSEVDNDGTGGRISQWTRVDKNVFDECAIGDKWPACKKEAERNEPRQERQKQQTLCFDFISDPTRKLTYRWRTPDHQEGPRTGNFGSYTKCVTAYAGQVANMTVEHVTGPSTVLCSIYVKRGTEKMFLKPNGFAITQEHGDCKVSGVVPAAR